LKHKRVFDFKNNTRSPPARGRGLKLLDTGGIAIPGTSPPARGRGLKLYMIRRIQRGLSVAPRAGAWIETGDLRP